MHPQNLVALAALISFAWPCFPQQENEATAPTGSTLPLGEKFLFIVDTSESMDRLVHEGRQALFDLIHSGIYDHMQSGDTFGVWTFDKSLHTGEYPMQTWFTTNKLAVASSATQYVKSKDYMGSSSMELAIVKALEVVKIVKDVNIFIISDEKARMKGTAFDDLVNKTYRKRDNELRATKKPFVTTLLARNGELVSAEVHLAGEPITLPPRPIPVLPPPSVQASTQTATNPVSKVAKEKPAAHPPTSSRSIIITAETIKAENAAISALAQNALPKSEPSVAPVTSPPPTNIISAVTEKSLATLNTTSSAAAASLKPIQSVLAESDSDGESRSPSLPPDNPTPSPNPSLTTPEPPSDVIPVAAREKVEDSETQKGIQLTALTPPLTGIRTKSIWIFGAIGLGALLLIAFAAGRKFKRRSPHPTSFITRSMDK